MVGVPSRFKEPKDPPLITNFLRKLKNNRIMAVSNKEDILERNLNKARAKMMAKNKLESNLEGKAKEFMREKRLSLAKVKLGPNLSRQH